MIRVTRIVFLIGHLFTSVYSDCIYVDAPSYQSNGCAENCLDFDNLNDAKEACNADPSCNAITFSQPSNGGSESIGATGNGWGYQLRASIGTNPSSSGQTTWVKLCTPNDFKSYEGTYLGGCFNSCQDYPTLVAAENACRSSPGCGGVTFSKRSVGGPSATNAFNHFWGYQLRSGTNPTSSPNGEDSWLKIASSSSNQDTDCYMSVPGTSISGCSEKCKDFSSLSSAEQACNNDSSCEGITFSQPKNGGCASVGAVGNGWGYQLRSSSSTNNSQLGETSWIKVDCQSSLPCDYLPGQGYYLPGCDNSCQDFSTLEAAQAACRLNVGCGGVTFSKRSIGGSLATNAFDGVWGYQLRSGTTLILSPNGEDSWQKQICK